MRPLYGEQHIDIDLDGHDADFIGEADPDPSDPTIVVMRTKKMNGSYIQLIQPEDEDPRKSLSASVRERRKWWRALKPLKTILFKLKLLFVIALYSLFGAWLFMHLEVPTDLAKKEKQFNQRFIARDDLVIRLRGIHQDNRENREEKWKEAIISFEQSLDMDEPVIETSWTFWMSFLYAGTIFTTIGYGNIACATTAGQVATVIYAIFGIPIMIVILNDLGDVLLFMVKGFTNGVADVSLLISVKLGFYGLEEDAEQRKRYNHIMKRLGQYGLADATSLSTLTTDYQRALESGDPKAIEGMMSGFQGKAKFLMPLISKNAGNKVMNQFKEEAKAKGIDIPPVLTNLDPQTGMPAFAKADRGDFREFIEAAEVKKQQTDRIEQLFSERQTRSPSFAGQALVNTAMVTEEMKKKTAEVEIQTWTLDELFQEWKPNCHIEVQTRPEMVEEHSHEGQVWPSMEEVYTQYDVALIPVWKPKRKPSK
ncbi:unnamed protein product, partial [Mesorhabditis spiculigera]